MLYRLTVSPSLTSRDDGIPSFDDGSRRTAQKGYIVVSWWNTHLGTSGRGSVALHSGGENSRNRNKLFLKVRLSAGAVGTVCAVLFFGCSMPIVFSGKAVAVGAECVVISG